MTGGMTYSRGDRASGSLCKWIELTTRTTSADDLPGKWVGTGMETWSTVAVFIADVPGSPRKRRSRCGRTGFVEMSWLAGFVCLGGSLRCGARYHGYGHRRGLNPTLIKTPSANRRNRRFDRYILCV
jgi:hypothetical protein